MLYIQAMTVPFGYLLTLLGLGEFKSMDRTREGTVWVGKGRYGAV
jgi:hypothetical protein